MNYHVFIFNGSFYLQEDGGSIGVRLTGLLAEVMMILWCKSLKEKRSLAGIKGELLPRFVDDITILPTVIPSGMRLVDNKLEFSPDLVDTDNNVNGDERTMIIIQEIANSITDDIQVTFDVPSNHSDNRIPILDLKVRINVNNEIEYIFYKKPMSSDYVTLKNSALSMQQKMATLTQQCFSRIHNTSDNVDEDVKFESLNEFMHDLQISGYSEKDRLTILRGAINTHKNIK